MALLSFIKLMAKIFRRIELPIGLGALGDYQLVVPKFWQSDKSISDRTGEVVDRDGGEANWRV